jgi:hypothetical protein
MQAMAFNWLGIHSCYLVLCGLVEQPNITQYNLCLVVCNGDETKLGSNFDKRKPKILKIWKTQSLDQIGSWMKNLKRFKTEIKCSFWNQELDNIRMNLN